MENAIQKGPKTLQQKSLDEPLTTNDAGAIMLGKLVLPTAWHLYSRPEPLWPTPAEKTFYDAGISIRKIEEALSLAKPILCPILRRSTHKRLQRFRRDLSMPRWTGSVRDTIALLTQQTQISQNQSQSILNTLSNLNISQKKNVRYKYTKKRLSKHAKKLLSTISKPLNNGTSFKELALKHLSNRTSNLQQVVNELKTTQHRSNYHQLRQRLKKVHYTSDILSPAFPGMFKTPLELLCSIQDQLQQIQLANHVMRFLSGKHIRHIIREDTQDRLISAAIGHRNMIHEQVFDSALGETSNLLDSLHGITAEIQQL